MWVEKTILEKEDKNRDALSLEKEAEEKASAVETNQKLDAEFENLRKATEIKDQIFTKIESTLNQAMEWKPYLKKHIETKVLFEQIEKLFYYLDDDKDKVAVMENILTILESGKKYSVKEIYNIIYDKIDGKLGIIEWVKSSVAKELVIKTALSLALIVWIVIGAMEWTIGIAATVLATFLIAISWSAIEKISDKIDEKEEKHRFFDQINDYVPNITKEDFDILYENIHKFNLTEFQQSLREEHILSLLEDYKKNDWVVTQEEISALIKFTNNL